jgi:hypothetical protein
MLRHRNVSYGSEGSSGRVLQAATLLANLIAGGFMQNRRKGEAGGATIGSRKGGPPDVPKETDTLESGKVHRTGTERRKLMEDPNLNQAGNDRGSADQGQGSQTGNDIDLLPE